MRTKLERLFLGLIIAPLAPLSGLLGGWFIAYATLPENWIPPVTILGIALGILVDIFFLKKLLEHPYDLPPAFWLSILLFYAVGMFGFFMGVPVLNVFLAIPTGFVVGGWLAHKAADLAGVRAATIRTCILTTVILFLTCAGSASVALASPSTPHDLEGMLRLGFEVTQTMIWGLILVGGAVLLAVNWALTNFSVRFSYHFLRSS